MVLSSPIISSHTGLIVLVYISKGTNKKVSPKRHVGSATFAAIFILVTRVRLYRNFWNYERWKSFNLFQNNANDILMFNMHGKRLFVKTSKFCLVRIGDFQISPAYGKNIH